MNDLRVYDSGRYRTDVEGYSITVAVNLETAAAWVDHSEHPKYLKGMLLPLKNVPKCECEGPCFCLPDLWVVTFP